MTNEGSSIGCNASSGRRLWSGIAVSGAIALSWLYLNLPTLQWFTRAVREMSLFNLVLLGLAGLFFIVQGIRHRQQLRWSAVPVLRPLPLALMFGSAIAANAFRWFLDLDRLPAICFILGSYGLLGLFLDSAIWQRRLSIALAIATLLPFCIKFGTGLGFPVRMLTARAVEFILARANVSALSSQDIIVLENGISQVDLPCSGLRSLWIGTLFLLTLTWLEGRRIDIRWLLVSIANLVSLTLANIVRVLALVILVDKLNQPEIANMLHIPLGLMGFLSCCLLAWGLLRFVPKQRSEKRTEEVFRIQKQKNFKSLVPQALVAICVLALTLLPQPPSIAARSLTLADLQLPASIATQEISLSPYERDFFQDYPGVEARKLRFEVRGLSGSAILVFSPTWQAHHSPELCLLGSGFQVDKMERRQLAPDMLGRWLSLNNGERSAAYWFQSSKRTTDEYLARLWGEMNRREPIWVMASVLFDRASRPDDSAVQTLIASLNQAIDRRLEE
jgi:exosortase O